MVRNKIVPSVIMPNRLLTNVANMEKWIYDLNAPEPNQDSRPVDEVEEEMDAQHQTAPQQDMPSTSTRRKRRPRNPTTEDLYEEMMDQTQRMTDMNAQLTRQSQQVTDIQAQQTAMMQLIQQMQQQQIEQGARHEARMDTLTIEMGGLSVRMDAFQEILHHVGLPCFDGKRRGHGRARGRGPE